MRQLLKELCALDALPGREDAVREFILRRAQADDVSVDTLGNVLVFKRGERRAAKKVLFMAHMDEVGLICKSVTDEGYIKFAPAGAVDARVLPGKTVRAGASKTPGVIGIKPTHLCEDGEQENALPVKALYIDIGAGSRDEALAAVAPGDPIYFTCEQLEQGGFLRAKALDDRVGCCVLLAMLARPQPVDCAYAFTAQEEVGARGAHTAAYAAEPDIAVIVEGTTAADLPGAGAKKVCVPGKGAVLPFMDKGTFYDRELFLALRRLAGERGIPWQAKEYVSGGTDASAAQRSRSGVRAACIAAAVRYIHSPASAMCLADLEHILGLAEAALAHFGGGEYV